MVAGAGGAWLWKEFRDRRSTRQPAEAPYLDRGVFPRTAGDLEKILVSYFSESDLAAVMLVGNVYILQLSNDDRSTIEDLASPVRLVADLPDAARARFVLDRAVKRDHEAMRLASVDGWQLSVTEARLCGLAYHLLRKDVPEVDIGGSR